jgi:hypothetical protein
VTEGILNQNDYHFADSCRAILSYMNRSPFGGLWIITY